jgi:hypothetical protein
MLARKGSGACPVCGWVHDESASVQARFCACCGIERGVQDRSMDQVKSWRNKWLTSGGRWCGAMPMAEETGAQAEPDSTLPRL